MTLYRVSAPKRLGAVAVTALAVGLAIFVAPQVRANETPAPLPAPTQAVILSIEGKIQNTNIETNGAPAPRADFDLAMLMAMAHQTIETTTPWTEGTARFEGVAVKEVLSRTAPIGDQGEFIALNDTAVRIPLENLSRMNAIIAYRMNGELMSVRNRGPLWLVYPLDQIPQSKTDLYRNRMIWQLRTIIVK